jgi:diguanylate cyclase (GGDEF)-like protein
VTLDLKNEAVTQYKCGGPGTDKLRPNSFQELWDGLTGWVIRERKPALSPKDELDLREEPHIQEFRQETDGGSVIVVPLQYQNNILGTLTAINRIDQTNFTQRDVDLMVTIGNQTAIAIANAQLFETVQNFAITDALAGTYNRRHLFELGNIEFRRARRFGRALSVVMLDLDHFKVINDTHGHAVGDRVLNAVAQRCLNHIRDIDILGRYGGEEFIILLPETGAKAAYSLADRLRKRVAEKAVSTKVGPIYITISLGVAMLCDDDPDLETLFDHADSALYAAKEAGRNCVAYYKPNE